MKRQEIPRDQRTEHRAEVIEPALQPEGATAQSPLGVASAISASRGGVRSPLPSRSTTRSPITCQAAPVKAITGRTTTAAA